MSHEEGLLASIKQRIKPFFLRALEGVVALRWRLRNWRGALPHGLPFPLVVSLTSYPARYPVLELTLKTILTQSVRPDETVLWVAEADAGTLPEGVRALTKDGLTIKTTEDTRSYKKILPLMARHHEVAILTCDDDVYYPRDWLIEFTRAYRPGSANVLANRVHRMKLGADGLPVRYDDWRIIIPEKGAHPLNFFTGVGGVFYPPGSLHADATDLSAIRALCPTTDDVWLNWMVRLAGGDVEKIGPRFRFFEWPGSQSAALQNINRGASTGNDEQIRQIIARYGFAWGRHAE